MREGMGGQESVNLPFLCPCSFPAVPARWWCLGHGRQIFLTQSALRASAFFRDILVDRCSSNAPLTLVQMPPKITTTACRILLAANLIVVFMSTWGPWLSGWVWTCLLTLPFTPCATLGETTSLISVLWDEDFETTRNYGCCLLHLLKQVVTLLHYQKDAAGNLESGSNPFESVLIAIKMVIHGQFHIETILLKSYCLRQN